jgi:hypothetical protein
LVIHITMKTPDAVMYGISDKSINIENAKEAAVFEDEAYEVCSKFFQYGECCTIEIDLEKETAKVLKV